MFISSLCEYRRIMAGRGDAVPDGYSRHAVKYRVCLSEDGDVEDVVDLAVRRRRTRHAVVDGRVRETAETETVYPERLFPRRSLNTTTCAYVAEHRPLQLFGLELSGGRLVASAKAARCHEVFRNVTTEFIGGCVSPLCRAFLRFSEKWDPAGHADDPLLTGIGSAYRGASFEFTLTGYPDKPLEEDPELRERWEAGLGEGDGARAAQCSVYGESLPVARIHERVRMPGGPPTGCSLVSFNWESEESYGLKQSYNGAVSERAMREYTEALDFLLRREDHHVTLDGVTFVYFALTADEESYNELIDGTLKGDIEEVLERLSRVTPAEADMSVANAMELMSEGRLPRFETFPDTEYCIFGLVPNEGRISVRYMSRGSFGKLAENVARFHEDFSVEGRDCAQPLRKIAKELVSGKSSSERLAPDVGVALVRSMLQGTPLPDKILYAAVTRVRTDRGDENDGSGRLDDCREGIIKACLNRRTKKEKIKMSLDRKNTNPAYLCGRMFAVLEKIQSDSLRVGVSMTMGDRYFSSACATPAAVFPRLFALSRSHEARLPIGTRIYYDNLMNDICEGLDGGFPRTLSLEDQGFFIIGYRQQNRELYKKQENRKET